MIRIEPQQRTTRSPYFALQPDFEPQLNFGLSAQHPGAPLCIPHLEQVAASALQHFSVPFTSPHFLQRTVFFSSLGATHFAHPQPAGQAAIAIEAPTNAISAVNNNFFFISHLLLRVTIKGNLIACYTHVFTGEMFLCQKI